MNGAADCHEIPGCPNLFIDAFRGHYLSVQSKDATNVFVLTHYHGDHYGTLPRDFQYVGPAVIHCTPVTAALLRRVPEQFVCEHRYGEAWEVAIVANRKTTKDGGNEHSNDDDEERRRRTAQLTFYDANHCPGAAMVFIQVPSFQPKGSSNSQETFVHHLHTGDFRYHPRMQNYPRLMDAVRNRTLDCLWLDTTFAHPRHSFVPQSVAIDAIASHVHQALSSPPSSGTTTTTTIADSTDTLVLLGCYSIGKERVLWEVARRTQRLVHVSEPKLRKLECVALPTDENDAAVCQSLPRHHRLVDRCTIDPSQSDVHVVPMGLAGELWPYFQPRYDNCYEYAARLSKPYHRVVALVPTGWAHGSKWNREHSCCRQTYKGMEVEIRLVPYSEHSSFQELEQFVAYCKPRIVVPTVFADDKDRRRIQSLFPIDSHRAKQHFFFSHAAASEVRAKEPTHRARLCADNNDARETPMTLTKDRKRKAVLSPSADDVKLECNVDDEVEQLMAMGFARDQCHEALKAWKGSVEGAVEWLIHNRAQGRNGSTNVLVGVSDAPPTPEAISPGGSSTSEAVTPRQPPKRAQKTLLNYFARKS